MSDNPPSSDPGATKAPPPQRETIWGPEGPPSPALPPGWKGALPPPPGQAPYWAPSTRAPLRALLPGALLCLAVLAAAVGLVVYAQMNDDTYPAEWDPKVADLVDYVEGERGLRFEHPVHVDFLTAGEYSDMVRVDAADLTEEDTDALDEQMAVLRALGLASGEVDPVETTNDLADAGTLAYYDIAREHVVVRGTELTVDLQVTLVHELVHVLQDQHFDLEDVQADLGTGDEAAFDDAFSGYQALVEGDAVRIENAYVQSLSDADRQAYVDTYSEDLEDAEEELDDVPAALQADLLAPYLLGNPLVNLVAADGGNAAVDRAFRQLPATGEHMLDPRSYLAPDGPAEPSELDAPPLPDGVDDTTDEGIISAVDLYVLLAERIDPLVALDAADGWGNARYVTFEQDDRTCVRLNVDNDTGQDASQLYQALEDWIAAAPAAADAHFVDDAPKQAVESCDPGIDERDINDRALDVLQVAAFRSQLMYEGVELGGLDPDTAWQHADCMVDELGYDDTLAVVYAADEADLPAAFEPAMATCDARLP